MTLLQLTRRSSLALKNLRIRSFAQAATVVDHAPSDKVQFSNKEGHELAYVQAIRNIENGPISTRKVPAFTLKNNAGIEVKAMAQGGCMVQLKKNGQEYIWDNREGAVYYGEGANAFPLDRGLILHGGVRFAAVTAEHGLYYDTPWKMEMKENDTKGESKSIVLSIVDTQEQRDALRDALSVGQFNRPGGQGRLSKYPVTNLEFQYKITLNANESFVRLKMSVVNNTDDDAIAEAWLPMTFPIDENSQIICKQRKRWRRDEWVSPEQPNIVDFENSDYLNYPLKWEKSGIYYDWPYMDGHYHAVNYKGRGCAYVVPDQTHPHFMKLWSWGNRNNFTREPIRSDDPDRISKVLAQGRPKKEYYEPWGSAFNFAFFQTAEFKAKTTYSWEAMILPIESGLDNIENELLQKKVEKAIVDAGIPIKKLQDGQRK